MRPMTKRYIVCSGIPKPLTAKFTIESSGMNIHLAATEKTNIIAKTIDQNTIPEKFFIRTFRINIFLIKFENGLGVKYMERQVLYNNKHIS